MNTIEKLSVLVRQRGLNGVYSDLGNIYTKVSPEGDLILFNYTPLAMYKGEWNEFEMVSRGLVMNANGDVVAMPFRKFFNLNQNAESSEDWVNRVGIEYVTEKMDGSLGILYFWGDWKIITRGSFESDQSKKAYQMLAKYNLSKLMPNATYLLEIIYPENRVVVSYGDKEFLCLLAVMDNKTGMEYYYSMCKIAAEDAGFDLPAFYPPMPLAQILALRDSTLGVEGWVLSLKDGGRVKVKTEEYLTLHRAVSNITPKNLFAAYEINRNVGAIVAGYPDEFKDEVESILNGFKSRFYEILHEASSRFLEINHLTNRREFAREALKFKWAGLLFGTLDGKDIVPMILDIIKKEL